MVPQKSKATGIGFGIAGVVMVLLGIPIIMVVPKLLGVFAVIWICAGIILGIVAVCFSGGLILGLLTLVFGGLELLLIVAAPM